MDVIRVAALQFPLPAAAADAEGRAAWAAELDRRVGAAKADGADLVVLPAGSGAGPEGMPALAAWARVAQNRRRFRRDEPPADAWVAYCARGAALARSHEVYLVPGSVVVAGEGGWAHVAGLFGPDGDLLGQQAQGHWPAAAIASGWAPSDSLELVDLDGWPTALLLGYDATMPEGLRLAERAGARLSVALTAWPVPFNPWRQVAAVWSAVQQTQVPCVESCLIGPLRGHLYAGHSAIYGPCEGTPGESGWYAQAEEATEPALLLATLKAEVLDRVRSTTPIARFLNPALYRRHFAAAYPSMAASEHGGASRSSAAGHGADAGQGVGRSSAAGHEAAAGQGAGPEDGEPRPSADVAKEGEPS